MPLSYHEPHGKLFTFYIAESCYDLLMENNTPPLAGMPVPTGSSKAGMIGLAVAMLVIGLIAGYYLGNGKSGNVAYQTPTPQLTPLNNTPPQYSPTATPSTSATPTPIHWETYNDATYGLTFQYPSGHTLHKSNFVNTAYGTEEHSVEFTLNDNRYEEMGYNDTITFTVKVGSGDPGKFLKTAFGNRYDEGVGSGKLQWTTFAGRQAIVDNSHFLSGGFKTLYVYGFKTNSNYFILIGQGSNDPTLSQILSTFRFIR